MPASSPGTLRVIVLLVQGRNDAPSTLTGNTAWTPAIGAAAAEADLLIAEAYYWDKAVPHHLRHADLAGHREELRARRTVLTHMAADMLGHQDQAVTNLSAMVWSCGCPKTGAQARGSR